MNIIVKIIFGICLFFVQVSIGQIYDLSSSIGDLCYYDAAQNHIIEDEINEGIIYKGLIKSSTPRAFSSNSLIVNSLEECDIINFSPKSTKPDFNIMLAGVRYALITNKPTVKAHEPAFNSLYKYLQDMGFESISYLSENHVAPKYLCEEVRISLAFKINRENLSNIKIYDISMKFTNTGTEYSWDFSTSKTVRLMLGNNPLYDFGPVLRTMYGYAKNDFDPQYRMVLAKRQTCWTESKLKSYIQSKGCDKIEGIYESSTITKDMPKYKVALRKINGTYYLIYLSGANNTGDWREGEIKATLEPTATPLLYKAKWIMSDKSENDNYYITIEQGMFNLLTPNSEKQLYIKLFPSTTDNFSNFPSDIVGSGTGYAVSSNGYIVTNHHVIDGASSINVRGINGDFSKTYSAKVVIVDKNNDLAIIKIADPKFSSLGAIPFVISKKTSDVGSSVFVLGYPLRATMGDEIKLTNGIISAKSGFQGDVTSYQISAPVQPGNSGGPLFDVNGNIIGIINAKLIGAENASYAIKASYILNLIDLMSTPPKLQTISSVSGKPLTEQVKVLKKLTYIIEIKQ